MMSERDCDGKYVRPARPGMPAYATPGSASENISLITVLNQFSASSKLNIESLGQTKYSFHSPRIVWNGNSSNSFLAMSGSGS